MLTRHALLLLSAPHTLRWRLETFGLYMPSLPEARPLWRVNAMALTCLLWQLPGYARWLADMHALRAGGAPAFWRERASNLDTWKRWLELSDSDEPLAFSDQPKAKG